MVRGFRNVVRMKPTWNVLMIPREVDNVREIYGLLGKGGSITCLVNFRVLDEYKRELSYLPYGGPRIAVLSLSHLSELSGLYDTAIFLVAIDSFRKPEDVLFDVYRLLRWHGYLQIIYFVAGGKLEIWERQPDRYGIKIAALLKKTGFILSDARAIEIVDGIWVKIEGVKRENLSDEDIAY